MLPLVGQFLGWETSERQGELQKYVYTENKGIAMEPAVHGRVSLLLFYLSDHRRSPCSF